MKLLKIKKRVSDAAATGTSALASPSADPPADRPVSSSSASADPPALVPSPPSTRKGRNEHPPAHPPSSSPQEAPGGRAGSPVSSVITQSTAASHAGVKFASELDNANVEAYLEYLTRPHTSWESATRHVAHHRKVIENHRASVLARSLASSRCSSLASTMRSGGGVVDALEMSTTSSVASAPAGFPRSAANASKTQTGMLRKGRLGDAKAMPDPPALIAVGSVTTSALTPASSSSAGVHAHSVTDPGRTTSSRSSVGTTGQRASTQKGRLSRGGALVAPRATRISASSAGPVADSPSMQSPDLTIGGTQLHTGSIGVSVGSASDVSVTGRNASRDGTVSGKNPKNTMQGRRNVGSA